jgi:hypothetical protein
MYQNDPKYIKILIFNKFIFIKHSLHRVSKQLLIAFNDNMSFN